MFNKYNEIIVLAKKEVMDDFRATEQDADDDEFPDMNRKTPRKPKTRKPHVLLLSRTMAGKSRRLLLLQL